MKFALVSAAAVVSALIAVAPASAVSLGTITAPSSANIASGNINVAGPNTTVFTFTLTNAAAIAASSITNTSVVGSGVFDFTSVNITNTVTNLVAATYVIGARNAGGTMDATLAPITLLGGSYSINVTGNVSGPPASYGGNISFAAAAVPEVATWGMMVLGFGAVGGALRTSRRKVVFA